MNLRLLILAAAINSALGLTLEPAIAAPPQTQARATETWAPGRLLLQPRAGLPAKALENILKEHKGRAKKIGQSDLYVVEVPATYEAYAVEKLKNHPHLKFAELDWALPPALIPNDPIFNPTQDKGWHLDAIGAPPTWDITRGAGVTIAILDSGVWSAHPDLAANMVPGWNFFNNDADTSDVMTHGTLVAGAAAAVTNNGIGVAAVAGDAKIMPMRVTDLNGYGYPTAISQSLIWAADRGARVANASFGGLSHYASVTSAAQYFKDKGGLVTTSAGNSGALETYPATTSMIYVAATDKIRSGADEVRTSWSSYGDYVSMAAPGSIIYSTCSSTCTLTTYDATTGTSYTTSTLYTFSAGTSFSAPITGGVIALMMSANPKLSPNEIEKLLFTTAKDLGDPGRDIYYGYGRVDAAAAVQAAKNAVPFVDTTAPTVSLTNPIAGATVSGLVPVDVTASDDLAVSRVELRVNGTTVAIDTTSPFGFSWDSAGAPNGINTLVAHAFDAAGNTTASSSVSVNVANAISTPTADTTPPVVFIVNPVAGNVSGSVTITANASDNSSAAGITLSIYIDNKLKASGTGGTLSTSWNTSKGVKTGNHTIRVDAVDKAGNRSSASVSVNVVK